MRLFTMEERAVDSSQREMIVLLIASGILVLTTSCRWYPCYITYVEVQELRKKGEMR